MIKKRVSKIGFVCIFIFFISACIAMLTIPFKASAESSQPQLIYEDMLYNGVKGNRIIGYQLLEEPNTDLIISSANTPNGLPVFEIDSYAFTGSQFRSVKILNSGYTINLKSYAFNSLDVETSIELSSSTTFYDQNSPQIDAETSYGISQGVFASCSAKTIIILPSDIKIIGEDMFSMCDNLNNIEFTNGNSNILPNSLHTILPKAFQSCPIKEITIPNTVEVLGKHAFGGWTPSQKIFFKALEISEEWKAQCGEAIIDASGLWVTFEDDIFEAQYIDKYNEKKLPVPNIKGHKFNGWQDEKDQMVTDSLGNIKVEIKKLSKLNLTVNKTALEYKFSFNQNGGSGGTTGTFPITYKTYLPSGKIAPTRTGYVFRGYYYDNVQYYNSQMQCNVLWEIDENVELVASWSAISCYITLDKQGGTGGSTTLLYPYGSDFTFDTKKAPIRTGYLFDGYFLNANGVGTKYFDKDMNMLRKWDVPQASTTLYAKWIGKTYFIEAVKEGGSGGTSYFQPTFGSPMPSATAPTRDKHSFQGYYTSANGGGTQYYDSGMNSTRNWDIDVKTGPLDLPVKLYAYWIEDKGCVATGTFITLADGSQKLVENLNGNELLLVWNLQTGSFDTAPILFIDMDVEQEYEIIILIFSDGTEIKVIDEHAFWDFDLNKYVFMRKDAAQYVGHWFNKQITDVNGNLTWTKVQLTDVNITLEVTTAWSPVTYEHLCFYVNGMLSMPGSTEGLINIFEVNNDTMQYNEEAYIEDIEKYGLFTYEEFNAIMLLPEEIFNAFNGQHLKVSIGKGLITWEKIEQLIESYSEFFN